MAAPQQLAFPFASLDFPGRTTLTAAEIATKLGCTEKHIMDLAEECEFPGLDLAGKDSSRRFVKFPIEAYRKFVLTRMTGPFRADFLRDLPRAVLEQLEREIKEALAS
ncbi:MAG: hypothetical protein KF715_08520 [Candidatus Didemnitutus sp.]|nr:hypothetical protein [Candidatus Didemnitutus sp.]